MPGLLLLYSEGLAGSLGPHWKSRAQRPDQDHDPRSWRAILRSEHPRDGLVRRAGQNDRSRQARQRRRQQRQRGELETIIHDDDHRHESSKAQAPSSREIPSPNPQRAPPRGEFWSLEFGPSLELGVWSLPHTQPAELETIVMRTTIHMQTPKPNLQTPESFQPPIPTKLHP